MSLRALRRCFLAVVVVLGALVLTPGVAQAAVAASGGSTFPSSVTVGSTGLPAFITLTNANTPPDDADTNIVCNFGDASPPCSAGEQGITLMPSCGQVGGGVCVVPDPGVFQLSPFGFGRVGTFCGGMLFSITLIDPVFGTVRFTPLGPPVTLPGVGASCVIDFTFDVLKVPTFDQNPGVPGLQTVQTTRHTQFDPGIASAALTTSSNGTTVLQAQPTIATTASPTIALGVGTLSDTATVSSRVNPQPGATVTFQLFGPGDVTCVGGPFFTSTVAYPVVGGPVSSGAFTPTTAGTYRWVASYSGDANNNPVTGACNDANETVVVNPGTPTISTTASPPMNLGSGSLTDTAVVSGRVNPQVGATIDFTLYGPGDATCTGTPVFTASGAPYPVAGGPVTSPAFTPTTAGTYRWIATYSGDVNNAPVTGACNDANEATVVARAVPTIATTASPTIALGAGQVTDDATVSGRVNPIAGATITFTLFGPGNPTCVGAPIFTSTGPYPVAGGAVSSAAFTPTQAGTYHWIASYSGEGNNAPVTGACNEPSETVIVTSATPTIATTASPDIVLGAGPVSDSATVSGRVNPVAGATVTFTLFGPNNATCTGAPIFTSAGPYPVAGGAVGSAAFTPTQVGTYRWIATYSGDVNNAPVTGACNDANETVVVSQATPTIVTTASADMVLGGGQLSDTAAVSGRVNPVVGATVDFRLYGPNDATCSATPVFESLNVAYPVVGGSVGSAAFTPTQAGTYRWRAFYSGDANNAPVSGACNAANETAVVARATPTVATTASGDIVVGAGQLTDTATVSGRVNPVTGATVDFRLYGPNDATCSGTPVFESLSVALSAGGTATSGAFTPTQAGTYRWRAFYSGDANNEPVSEPCNAANESVNVSAAIAAETARGAPGGSTLPRTGSDPNALVYAGFACILCGIALIGSTRRRLAVTVR